MDDFSRPFALFKLQLNASTFNARGDIVYRLSFVAAPVVAVRKAPARFVALVRGQMPAAIKVPDSAAPDGTPGTPCNYLIDDGPQ
ncbi:MAG: hypothetical protein WB764_21015 [Xanthobacteraceae bacterium]